MKPYDPDAKCPKCGGLVIDVDWRGKCAEYDEEREHIRCRCRKCGYQWHAVPLDAKP